MSVRAPKIPDESRTNTEIAASLRSIWIAREAARAGELLRGDGQPMNGRAQSQAEVDYTTYLLGTTVQHWNKVKFVSHAGENSFLDHLVVEVYDKAQESVVNAAPYALESARAKNPSNVIVVVMFALPLNVDFSKFNPYDHLQVQPWAVAYTDLLLNGADAKVEGYAFQSHDGRIVVTRSPAVLMHEVVERANSPLRYTAFDKKHLAHTLLKLIDKSKPKAVWPNSDKVGKAWVSATNGLEEFPKWLSKELAEEAKHHDVWLDADTMSHVANQAIRDSQSVDTPSLS